MNRNRFFQFILIALTILPGIAIYKLGYLLPDMLADYLADTLWAIMIFWLIGFIFKNKSTLWVAVAALAISYFIELTQLYHSPFIDSVRATTIGGLVLGYNFMWSDIVCYNIGVLIGALLELLFKKKT